MNSGTDPEEPTARRGLSVAQATIVAAAIAAAAGIGGPLIAAAVASNDTGSPSDRPTSSRVTTPPTSAPTPISAPTQDATAVLPPIRSGPTLEISPDVVLPGYGFTVTGSGYPPFALVQLNLGSGPFTSVNADGAGSFVFTSVPIDQSFCTASPAQLAAVVDGRATATATVRFCG